MRILGFMLFAIGASPLQRPKRVDFSAFPSSKTRMIPAVDEEARQRGRVKSESRHRSQSLELPQEQIGLAGCSMPE